MHRPKILELAQNLPITAQRVDEPEAARHPGRLVGHIHTTYLVISGFRSVEFDKGEPLVIRMLVENEAVAYQTVVKHVVDSPRMYFISFPEQVQSVNLRKHERIKVFMPAEVRAALRDEVRMLNAMIVNISAGGCAFTCANPVPAESEVRLSFTLPGERLVNTIAGTVLEARQRKAAFSHRARFADTAENRQVQANIAQWVSEISRYALE